jgi:hypothetical protein
MYAIVMNVVNPARISVPPRGRDPAARQHQRHDHHPFHRIPERRRGLEVGRRKRVVQHHLHPDPPQNRRAEIDRDREAVHHLYQQIA